jgi:hypothetical protein
LKTTTAARRGFSWDHDRGVREGENEAVDDSGTTGAVMATAFGGREVLVP